MTQILFILCFSFSLITYAQENEVKIENFTSSYSDQSIHEVSNIEVLEKVEGNMQCLDEEPCDKKYPMDKIVLKVTGTTEANQSGNNKIMLSEKSLQNDYRTGKSIIEITFRGLVENKDATLVYDNMGHLLWGGEIPFEFKIEIQSDFNKEFEEREFRIPVSNRTIYRFKVSYSEQKWSVEKLPELPSVIEVQGALAEKLFTELKNIAGEEASDMHAHGNLECLKPEGVEVPTCFGSVRGKSQALAAELSQEVYGLINSAAGIYSAYYSVKAACSKPTEYNELKETNCDLK